MRTANIENNNDTRQLNKNALAKQLLPLVYEVAARIARRVPQHVHIDDLVSAGMLGLANALDRYTADRASTFRSYAEFRIRGEIVDELPRRDLMSRDARIERKRLRQSIDELSQKLGRPANDDEVAGYLRISLDDYRELQLRVHDARPVSAEDVELTNTGTGPEDGLLHGEIRHRLAANIERLPERRRLVLWLFYIEELPLREIGEMLGVSASRVCQIRIEAVQQLRAWMNDGSDEVRTAA